MCAFSCSNIVSSFFAYQKGTFLHFLLANENQISTELVASHLILFSFLFRWQTRRYNSIAGNGRVFLEECSSIKVYFVIAIESN